MRAPSLIEIRAELPGDHAAVRRVNQTAFGGFAEADLVVALRQAGAVTLSLVGEAGGEIAGHILFSPVEISSPQFARLVVGLGPMAVLPSRQLCGIGSALVREGLRRCREIGVGAVVVLGHPGYYPRFGFSPAHELGLRSEYAVPPEAFMVLELVPRGLAGVAGTVKYHPAFGRV